MKFLERVLLDMRNVSTMADFGFNGLICRFMVGKLYPKTFFLKKIIDLVVRSKICNICDTRNFIG